jgi:hypothetical protein
MSRGHAGTLPWPQMQRVVIWHSIPTLSGGPPVPSCLASLIHYYVEGVIAPLFANVFLHDAFDSWMARDCPHIRFQRY